MAAPICVRRKKNGRGDWTLNRTDCVSPTLDKAMIESQHDHPCARCPPSDVFLLLSMTQVLTVENRIVPREGMGGRPLSVLHPPKRRKTRAGSVLLSLNWVSTYLCGSACLAHYFHGNHYTP